MVWRWLVWAQFQTHTILETYSIKHHRVSNFRNEADSRYSWKWKSEHHNPSSSWIALLKRIYTNEYLKNFEVMRKQQLSFYFLHSQVQGANTKIPSWTSIYPIRKNTLMNQNPHYPKILQLLLLNQVSTFSGLSWPLYSSTMCFFFFQQK